MTLFPSHIRYNILVQLLVITIATILVFDHALQVNHVSACSMPILPIPQHESSLDLPMDDDYNAESDDNNIIYDIRQPLPETPNSASRFVFPEYNTYPFNRFKPAPSATPDRPQPIWPNPGMPPHWTTYRPSSPYDPSLYQYQIE